MNALVASARAVADPNRVRILAVLRRGELCVCELCDALKLTQSTLSTHLQVLRRAGMVSARRDGKWSYYTLLPSTRPLVDSIFTHFAESVATDRRLAADSGRLDRRLARRDGGACCVGFGRTTHRPSKSCT